MKTSAVLLACFAAVTGVFADGAPKGATSQARATLATVYTKCTVAKTVALSFDDGPYNNLDTIVNALTAAGGKGTFFFNGDNYQCIYSADNQRRIKNALAKGHQLASHTWRHADLTTLTFDQLHDEMWRVEQALERIAGVAPAFMRPPYGNYNNLVRQVAAQRGQALAIWDLDSGDSTGASVATSKKVYADAAAKNPNNILALNHETYATTAQQLVPYAIQLLKSKGYKLVTVAECLGKQPYQWTTTPGTPDSSWHC